MKYYKGYRLLILFLFIPALAFSQLQELEVTPIETPDRAVPIFRDYPDAAAIIITSSIPNLSFDSNLGLVADRSQPEQGEYRLLLRPLRQTITVGGDGFKQLRFNINLSEPRQVQFYNVDIFEEEGVNVMFRVDQPQAKLIIDDQVYNDLSEPISLQKGPAEIRIEADGYRPIEEIVEITEKTVLFEYEMESIDPVVLTINSSPPGATILIGGVEVGQTNDRGSLQQFRFPGSYLIEATLNGYVTQSKVYQVQEEGENEVSFDLVKNSGVINLEVSPGDAMVLINGDEVDQTNRVELTPATYVIEVTKSGYLSQQDTISLAIGDELDLSYELVKNAGTVVFSVSPTDAEVLVNKELTPTGQEVDLAPGRYRVEVNKAGYNSLSDDIVISRGQNINKKYTLERQYGSLQFRVDPDYANVILSDQNGTIYEEWTGFKLLKDIPVGSYYLKIAVEGYTTLDQEIKIDEGQITSVNYSLDKIIKSEVKFNSALGDLNFTLFSQNRTGKLNVINQWKGSSTLNVEVGKYVLKYSKQGCETREREIMVKQKKETFVIEYLNACAQKETQTELSKTKNEYDKVRLAFGIISHGLTNNAYNENFKPGIGFNLGFGVEAYISRRFNLFIYPSIVWSIHSPKSGVEETAGLLPDDLTRDRKVTENDIRLAYTGVEIRAECIYKGKFTNFSFGPGLRAGGFTLSSGGKTVVNQIFNVAYLKFGVGKKMVATGELGISRIPRGHVYYLIGIQYNLTSGVDLFY